MLRPPGVGSSFSGGVSFPTRGIRRHDADTEEDPEVGRPGGHLKPEVFRDTCSVKECYLERYVCGITKPERPFGTVSQRLHPQNPSVVQRVKGAGGSGGTPQGALPCGPRGPGPLGPTRPVGYGGRRPRTESLYPLRGTPGTVRGRPFVPGPLNIPYCLSSRRT